MNTQITTSTVITSSSAVTKSTRGRKFEAAKWSMKRAWDISRNAAVAHNTNPIKVAEIGLVRASEFFKEALGIAWKEAKAKINNTPYEAYKMHNVPKKSVPTILNAISKYMIVNGLCSPKLDDYNTIINNTVKKSFNHRLALGEVVLNARYSTPAAKSTNKDVFASFNELVCAA